MILSMICWGSWANTIKLTPGWPIQLFYWDYVFGILLAGIAWGATLGGGPGVLFSAIFHADAHHLWLALLGGIIFNAANLLLVVAIEIAGLAVAFPLGIGLALVIGVLLNYAVAPAGNVRLLFGGVVLVAIAIVLDALAYRQREAKQTRVTARGIVLSLVAGVLMGLFYPFVARSMRGPGGLGPYSVVPVFALGIALCNVPADFWLMRHPLPGQKRIVLSEYFRGKGAWHVWGLLGGAIWCSGAVLNFVASQGRFVGPAISYALGQGATMVSAAWGVFIWREFSTAPAASRRLIPFMFLFFVLGLTAIALAPNY